MTSTPYRTMDAMEEKNENDCLPGYTRRSVTLQSIDSIPEVNNASVKEANCNGIDDNKVIINKTFEATYCRQPEEIVSVVENNHNRSFEQIILNISEGKVLYGREREKRALLEAFYRCISPNRNEETNQSPNEIILITGRSGTGKTALANTLREHVSGGGYFVSGKFDQIQKPEPYSTFVSAFSEYVRLVLDKEEETVKSAKEAIVNSMGSELCIITDMIPALEQIVGQQLSEASSATTGTTRGDAQKHHKAAFCKFVRATCSYDYPLILFIDDLQWSDDGSIDLIEALITDDSIEGLMVIGTCRYDEISRGHKLSKMLRKLENAKLLSITNIMTNNFTQDSIKGFVSTILQQAPYDFEGLSTILYEETNGNLFYILQYLRNLFENRILYMDNVDSQWRLNEDRLQTVVSSQDVVDLLVKKMEGLPFKIQELLMVASCIGADFDEYLLSEALAYSSDIDDVVSTAVELDLITFVDRHHSTYRFCHDKIQQAAYSLIPENERSGFHLYIGRRLLENLPPEELDLNIYLVVNQLSRGAGLFRDQEEKNNIASLCLQAGEKAASSSDFLMAASYLRHGIDLLDEDHWRDQYFISLDLYNLAAEMEYCNANFDQVDILVDIILNNARILRDRIRAYMTHVNSLGARQKLDMAIDRGLEVLKYLGQSFPSKPRKVYLMRDFLKTKKMLREKSDDEIMKLKDMFEWDNIAAMQLLNLVFTYAYMGRSDLLPFLIFRMVQLTMKFGLAAMSSSGFACYGMISCMRGELDEGCRYGQLALRILKKFNIQSWLPRVYVILYSLVNIWKKPLRLSLDPLSQAHRVGLQKGDIEYSMYAAYFYTSLSFYSGQELDKSIAGSSKSCNLMVIYKQDSVLTMTKIQLQTMLNFKGQASDPLVLTGEALNEETALQELRETKNASVEGLLHTMKLILSYFFNDYKLAIEIRKATSGSEKSIRGVIISIMRAFYHALSCLALVGEGSKRKRHMSMAGKALKRLKECALSCPDNFDNKVSLIEAEFAMVRNDVGVAMQRYNESIERAKSEGLRHECALAYERKGRFLLRLGGDNTTCGLSHLSRACSLYEEWGATAKVEQLRKIILKSSAMVVCPCGSCAEAA